MKKLIATTVVFIIVAVSVLYAFKRDARPASEKLADYKIVKKWELPKVLEEVSAIDWIAEEELAAVQDEEGFLFIYSLKTSEIKDRIEFAGGGDYEGLRINGKDAYILRSDGHLYELLNFRSENPEVIEHATELTKIEGMDMEGLTYDPKGQRLLLVTKDREKGELYKDIYEFSLAENRLSANAPVTRLELQDPVFEKLQGDKDERFTPSEMAIHPESGEYYFLEGKHPKLLITSNKAKPKALYLLKEEDFPQPEGLTFSPDGKLYISNEAGKKGAATILEVQLKK